MRKIKAFIELLLKFKIRTIIKLLLKQIIIIQETKKSIAIQDGLDIDQLNKANKIILFLVPGEIKITGGIMSIYHFAEISREIKQDALIIISTYPGYITHSKNNTFDNNELVYRFNQIIKNCNNLKEFIIHIPEYYVKDFYKDLSRKQIRVLKSIERLHINILNQNIQLMPTPNEVQNLYKLTNNITQTTGFIRYSTQEVADKYNIPLYYMPSFNNLNKCIIKNFEKKKKLILYSPDFHPLKSKILGKIQDNLIGFRLKEIKNLTYNQYLDAIADAMFCISFGEGFDGYYIQPYYAKSIGICVYNDTFFPKREIKSFPFVYESYEKMYEKIVNDINNIYQNKIYYEQTSKNIFNYFKNNINKKEYTIKGINKLYNSKPDYIPNTNKKMVKVENTKFNKLIILFKNYYTFKININSSIFYQKINALINNCTYYYYPDSYDKYRPDDMAPVKYEKSFFVRLKRYLKYFYNFSTLYNLSELEKIYHIFNDERSKEIYLMYLIYGITNIPTLRFPLYYSRIFHRIKDIEKLKIDNKEITLWFGYLKLYKFDLKQLGYNLKLWHNVDGIIIEFILEQYRYKNIVTVEENDNIIDGGGCYGDTAIYFASKTKGKIYSFEFIKENINVFKKNLILNPKYKKQIELVKKPLGKESNVKLYAIFNGPGTSISDKINNEAIEYKTISIDDYVHNNKINKIDFIKLDVEGSEEDIIKGAINTIKKYKPKLAICVYHKKEDIIILPKLIKEINPEYKIFFDHNTISKIGAVLYAKV